MPALRGIQAWSHVGASERIHGNALESVRIRENAPLVAKSVRFGRRHRQITDVRSRLAKSKIPVHRLIYMQIGQI
jgi:hypothetical protein